jgi:hypothetical protein
MRTTSVTSGKLASLDPHVAGGRDQRDADAVVELIGASEARDGSSSLSGRRDSRLASEARDRFRVAEVAPGTAGV